MSRLLLTLFLAYSMHISVNAAIWETIKGPTVLEGVVLMTGSNNEPIDNQGHVEQLVIIVIKKVISGEARENLSLAFSYNGFPQDTLKGGDIINVSFENNEKLSDFTAIRKIGNIFK